VHESFCELRGILERLEDAGVTFEEKRLHVYFAG
jgi:hypothetical protein